MGNMQFYSMDPLGWGRFHSMIESRGLKFLEKDGLVILADLDRDLLVGLEFYDSNVCNPFYVRVFNRNLMNFRKIRRFSELIENLLAECGAKDCTDEFLDQL